MFLDPTGDGVEVGRWEEDEKSLEWENIKIRCGRTW